MTCTAVGWALKTIVDSSSSFSDSSERYDVVLESLKRVRRFETSGISRGDGSMHADCVREKPSIVKGVIRLQPGMNALTPWFSRILRGSGNGLLGDAIPTFNIMLHRENGVFLLSDCVVNVADFISRTGAARQIDEYLELRMEILGKAESMGSWPDPEPTYTPEQPYSHHDSYFAIDGEVTEISSAHLRIHNNFIPSKFFQSLSPQCWRSKGRSVRLFVECPFTSQIHTTARAMADTPESVVLAYPRSGDGIYFSLPIARNNYQAPTVLDKGPYSLSMDLQGFRNQAIPELQVVSNAWT